MTCTRWYLRLGADHHRPGAGPGRAVPRRPSSSKRRSAAEPRRVPRRRRAGHLVRRSASTRPEAGASAAERAGVGRWRRRRGRRSAGRRSRMAKGVDGRGGGGVSGVWRPPGAENRTGAGEMRREASRGGWNFFGREVDDSTARRREDVGRNRRRIWILKEI